MLHTRVYTQPDDFALANLTGCQYKTLRYLVNRADGRGICYPGADTIAAATGYNRRHTQRALDALYAVDLMRYVSRDEVHPITRRQLPNAYQINPDYICLAAEAESEARAIWSSLIVWCGNDSVGLPSRTNQQPESLTNTRGPAPGNTHHITNTNNQRPPKLKTAGFRADYANQDKSQGEKPGQEQNPDAETSQRAARNMQRNAPASKSSVPPAKFKNPTGIHAPLDDWHEELAGKVRGLGIPLAMARGFVQEYGYDHCKAALSAVGEAVLNATADRPAGLFRHIIQRRLDDDVAAQAAQQYTQYRQPDVDDEPGY